MNKYKVCVYAICKNEEKFVDRWMDSMSEADLIVVTDTGSNDKTTEKLLSRGAYVYMEQINPWRFDTARNLSLDHDPADVDICVCTDLDELFEKGWRTHLEQSWTPDAKSGKYIYNWSLKQDGSPDIQMYYSKIHVRQGFKWIHPVHEWLSYYGKEPLKTVIINGMVLNHYPDNTKSRKSYLPLLELAVNEDPEGSRVTYYLGREYMYNSEWLKCIDTLKRYLTLPSSVWKEERGAAMRWIANSYFQLKDLKQAYSWFFRAIAETPDMRDPYVECAKTAYLKTDWPMAFFMSEEALKIKEKSKSFVNMGYCWDYTPHDLAAISCYRLGMYERAKQHAEAAIEISPFDERLKKNLQLIERKL
ncbi:tetratricopeptide repeat-containing glycosyltransferase [Anaerocolumna sp. MB42-C2]|uniref:tetratricopeptide repeat-containing glycosyltransferase n=1 Tax=Anaerocolumna sp. MB42-C2 TaxID=3070997 RepID=UPI0027DFC45C|nr:glycosyl transferase family 2 [Anaerocolumna sp. MB42-C2]WMJ89989.1 glycosyl transferase family 2 [Anaerocolumna sp. MB42-C2]